MLHLLIRARATIQAPNTCLISQMNSLCPAYMSTIEPMYVCMHNRYPAGTGDNFERLKERRSSAWHLTSPWVAGDSPKWYFLEYFVACWTFGSLLIGALLQGWKTELCEFAMALIPTTWRNKGGGRVVRDDLHHPSRSCVKWKSLHARRCQEEQK